MPVVNEKYNQLQLVCLLKQPDADIMPLFYMAGSGGGGGVTDDTRNPELCDYLALGSGKKSSQKMNPGILRNSPVEEMSTLFGSNQTYTHIGLAQ
jgi:hypothetical protein